MSQLKTTIQRLAGGSEIVLLTELFLYSKLESFKIWKRSKNETRKQGGYKFGCRRITSSWEFCGKKETSIRSENKDSDMIKEEKVKRTFFKKTVTTSSPPSSAPHLIYTDSDFTTLCIHGDDGLEKNGDLAPPIN
jgi:hypothetical protein